MPGNGHVVALSVEVCGGGCEAVGPVLAHLGLAGRVDVADPITGSTSSCTVYVANLPLAAAAA